jgi:hypothetical protein
VQCPIQKLYAAELHSKGREAINMAAVVDHFHMGSANIYTSVDKLQKELRLGHYDGGFMSGVVIGHKAFPLNAGVYIEVEAVIDPFAVPAGQEPGFQKKAEQFGTEVWTGVCLRVDTIAELEDIARRLGGKVNPHPSMRIRPDGPLNKSISCPVIAGAKPNFELGLPQWYCWEDRLYRHPAGMPTVPMQGLRKPNGTEWIEMGGDEDTMGKWLGQDPKTLGMRFNGKKPGLYAIGIRTDEGVIELRRPSANQDTLDG